MLKQRLKQIVVRTIARRQFQGIFERMHLLSLAGMNIGHGGEVGGSEQYALSLLLNREMPCSNQFVVFDVGANVGQFAQLATKVLRGSQHNVYCFEPSASTFQKLTHNLVGMANIRLNNFGLGERTEIVTLFSDKDRSVLASVYQRNLAHHGIAFDRTEQVELRMLDDYCESSGIEHIHYLKLDVEGHELKVLKGASRMLSANAIDLIQFEFGGCNVDSRTFLRDFFELLHPSFWIYRLLQNCIYHLREYREINEVFVTTNFLAVRRL